jgi:hypothetical protein
MTSPAALPDADRSGRSEVHGGIPAPARLAATFVWPAIGAGRRAQVGVKPSNQAVSGALDIYLGGWRVHSIRQVIFGLTVMQDATAHQLDGAIRARGRVGSPDEAGIRRLLGLGDMGLPVAPLRP